MYVIPLIAVPDRILTPHIMILILAGAVLLLTQPEIKRGKDDSSSVRDKGTVLLIVVAGVMSQIAPVIEWGYGRNGEGNSFLTVPVIIGLVMLIGGLTIRIWSIRILGRFFTPTVQMADDHRLVTSGPFSLVRHPSYFGAFVSIIGAGVFLNAPIGTVMAALAMSFAYWKRISAEEQALVDRFGGEYRQYQQTTKTIIPFVW